MLLVVGYAYVYYAVLYYLYRKDRMFEFYLIGFMLVKPLTKRRRILPLTRKLYRKESEIIPLLC